MTDISKLIESGEGRVSKLGNSIEEALEDAQTPMAALAAAYNHAPHPVIRRALNDRAMEILMIDLPVLQDAIFNGPAILRNEIADDTVHSCFVDSMTEVAEKAPQHVPSATVRQCGEDIAERIDAAIRAELLQDDYADRRAYSMLLSAHAQLMAALSSLKLDESQLEKAREMTEADREAAGGNQ